MSLDAKACRSCGAAIVWITLASGKNAPCDATPQRRILVEDGVGSVRTVYVSHFETCPHAAQHRKKRDG